MLRIKDDHSSNRKVASQVLQALKNDPVLIRRCFGIAAALIGLGLMTAGWVGPHDPLLVQVIKNQHSGETAR
ncbi:MAG TPA: hypothetical protein VJU53_06170 [Burkholderiaceae bacterium]|nr:hypothetical protein [Burkholderiaceae bacterium]